MSPGSIWRLLYSGGRLRVPSALRELIFSHLKKGLWQQLILLLPSIKRPSAAASPVLCRLMPPKLILCSISLHKYVCSAGQIGAFDFTLGGCGSVPSLFTSTRGPPGSFISHCHQWRGLGPRKVPPVSQAPLLLGCSLPWSVCTAFQIGCREIQAPEEKIRARQPLLSHGIF